MTRARLLRRFAAIEPVSEDSDCGYFCILAAFAAEGASLSLDELKSIIGRSQRGLSLRQLRDGFRTLNCEADVVFFDRQLTGAFPAPGIVLFDAGHYVYLHERRGERFRIFDPLSGWGWVKRPYLFRRTSGLGIQLGQIPAVPEHLQAHIARSRRIIRTNLARVFEKRFIRRVLIVFGIAQFAMLLIPLLSMWGVNKAVDGLSLGGSGLIILGFALLTCVNVLLSLIGDLAQLRLRQNSVSQGSRIAFDSLSQKPANWFERNSANALDHRLRALQMLINFRVDLYRSIASLLISMIAGALILLLVSPKLVIPGLIALALSISLDLLFERRQLELISTVVDSSQRQRSFVIDLLAHLPQVIRYGALSGVRNRNRTLVRHSSFSEARLASLRSWRSALEGISKAGENLFFVVLAASFVGAGKFEIGGFVALGAYKDQLAIALGGLFRKFMEYRTLQIYQLQVAPLFDGDVREKDDLVPLKSGSIEFKGVTFAYGTLDNDVLSDLNFRISSGQFVVIRGQSGIGKSTIAKLITGHLTPKCGSVYVDGRPPSMNREGLASLMQTDRLFAGTIRENVTLLRKDHSDKEVLEALQIVDMHDFVMALPMGLNTFISEGSAGLSGGQRQRMLLARALILRPRLLLLDEATASLDVTTERAIFDRLKSLKMTIVAITHRPEVWSLSDVILDLDDMTGPRAELLRLIDGTSPAGI